VSVVTVVVFLVAILVLYPTDLLCLAISKVLRVLKPDPATKAIQGVRAVDAFHRAPARPVIIPHDVN
jgi:hypothetical protein